MGIIILSKCSVAQFFFLTICTTLSPLSEVVQSKSSIITWQLVWGESLSVHEDSGFVLTWFFCSWLLDDEQLDISTSRESAVFDKQICSGVASEWMEAHPANQAVVSQDTCLPCPGPFHVWHLSAEAAMKTWMTPPCNLEHLLHFVLVLCSGLEMWPACILALQPG